MDPCRRSSGLRLAEVAIDVERSTVEELLMEDQRDVLDETLSPDPIRRIGTIMRQ